MLHRHLIHRGEKQSRCRKWYDGIAYPVVTSKVLFSLIWAIHQIFVGFPCHCHYVFLHLFCRKSCKMYFAFSKKAVWVKVCIIWHCRVTMDCLWCAILEWQTFVQTKSYFPQTGGWSRNWAVFYLLLLLPSVYLFAFWASLLQCAKKIKCLVQFGINT